MKKVFRGENSTIAHMWANKVQHEATNGSNFYYEGDTIYSYGRHFPIARHIENENGEKAVLFTERTYSNTTAKHITIVRQACSHLNVIYCPDLNNTSVANFADWLSQAKAIAPKLINAKKPEKYLFEIHSILARVKKYADFFNYAVPDSLSSILAIESAEQCTEYQENQLAIFEANRKKEAAKEKREHKAALKKWLNYETDRLYTKIDVDYLRMSEDMNSVETTQGVKIPIPAARSFWEKIKSGHLAVGDAISHYSVNEVGELVKIGCHTFPADYLIKFGNDHFKN